MVKIKRYEAIVVAAKELMINTNESTTCQEKQDFAKAESLAQLSRRPMRNTRPENGQTVNRCTDRGPVFAGFGHADDI